MDFLKFSFEWFLKFLFYHFFLGEFWWKFCCLKVMLHNFFLAVSIKCQFSCFLKRIIWLLWVILEIRDFFFLLNYPSLLLLHFGGFWWKFGCFKVMWHFFLVVCINFNLMLNSWTPCLVGGENWMNKKINSEFCGDFMGFEGNYDGFWWKFWFCFGWSLKFLIFFSVELSCHCLYFYLFIYFCILVLMKIWLL